MDEFCEFRPDFFSNSTILRTITSFASLSTKTCWSSTKTCWRSAALPAHNIAFSRAPPHCSAARHLPCPTVYHISRGQWWIFARSARRPGQSNKMHPYTYAVINDNQHSIRVPEWLQCMAG